MADRNRDQDRERERFRGRGRGAFMNYYEDMGTSSTEEGHTAFVKKKAEMEAKIRQAEQQAAAEAARLAEYSSNISGGEAEIKKAWGEYNKAAKGGGISFDQFKKGVKYERVNVIANGKIQGTYRIPVGPGTNAMEALKGYRPIKNKAGINIDVRQQGRIRGQEIHDMLRETTQQATGNLKLEYEKAKNQALTQLSGQLSKAKGQISQAEAQLMDRKGEYDSARANLEVGYADIAGAKSLMNKELGKIKQQYSQKLDVMRDIFTKMGIETKSMKVTPEGGGDIIPKDLSAVMQKQAVPETIIQTNGKVDQEKVKILAEVIAGMNTEDEEEENA